VQLPGLAVRAAAAMRRLPDVVEVAADGAQGGRQAAAGPRAGGPPPAPRTIPEHCRLQLVLKPTSDSLINMELWLPPADKWNGKFMGAGNGGFAGSIQGMSNDMPAALRLGYATAGTDTGHQDAGGEWAIGHPEKMIDFGYRATHEMTVKAKQLVKAFYDRGPQFSYFKSCSTGGRMAVMEAQRYPDDYDGIIAGALANRHIPHVDFWCRANRPPGAKSRSENHCGARDAGEQPGDEHLRHAEGRVP
jgi:feruloyl esterase